MDLNIGQQVLEKKTTLKFLGTPIDECLTWKYQTDQAVTKISKSLVIHAIRVIKSILYQNDLKALYYSLIYLYLTYGIEVWGNACKGKHLECITYKESNPVRHTGTLLRTHIAAIIISKILYIENRGCS